MNLLNTSKLSFMFSVPFTTAKIKIIDFKINDSHKNLLCSTYLVRYSGSSVSGYEEH